MQKKHVIIIGAGIGGLASACLLARSGYRVTVLEKNQTPGGKMQQYSRDGFRFDTGPSLLTMPFLLERLFETCSFSCMNTSPLLSSPCSADIPTPTAPVLIPGQIVKKPERRSAELHRRMKRTTSGF